MAQRWYYPREPGAFLMATAHYDLETKGAYSTIIDLLNERNRPVPNEDRFISGLLGCSPQKWRKIRDRLLDDGKLCLTDDGLSLTNPRFEREREEREGKHLQAVESGRKGGLVSAAKRQGELNLDEGFDDENFATSGKRVAKELQKSCESYALSLARSEKKTEQNQSPEPSKPQASRSRESQSHSKEEESPPTPSRRSHPPNRPNGLDDRDLEALFDAVCKASGFRPVSPGQIHRAYAQIESWRADGIDFASTVIPAIEAEIALTPEPTRTLGRFDKRIRHDHARLAARTKHGRKPAAPSRPMLSPDDEDPAFQPLRTALLERLGPATYANCFNPVRFEDVGQCHGDKHPVRLVGPQHLLANLFANGTDTAMTLKRIAADHGFTEVWA